MALNIVTSAQPLTIENIIVFIYGDPGVWKTSLAFTAKNPLLFDFDKGAYRAGVFRKDSVQISAWHEVAQFTAQDLQGYDTIIIDTAGRALDMITDVLRQDSKNTRRDGELSMQGYGRLGSMFTSWLKMLRGMGKDIILLAHLAEDKKGDDIIKRPDMVGSSKKEVYKVADMMAYMTVEQGKQGYMRTLSFNPSPLYHAKDSGCVGNIEVQPMDKQPEQMANIIQQAKDHLNSLSAEALKANEELETFRGEAIEASCADDFNALANKLDKSHPLYTQMKNTLIELATTNNMTVNKNGFHDKAA